jgi:hypothetical protein
MSGLYPVMVDTGGGQRRNGYAMLFGFPKALGEDSPGI